ncbi:MAG: Nudix family hydrolase [Thiohalomonadaceae bacterium]
MGDVNNWLHVAAAVIRDGAGRVLIAERPAHLHQGGLWEFPGGKVEPGEDVRAALARELEEELGIAVRACSPLIRVRHRYPDRNVLLDVWEVSAFAGEPHGREGQPVRWVDAETLPAFSFPAANLPIITAARLPRQYLITPEPGNDDAFLVRLEQRLRAGVRLVQLRCKSRSGAAFAALAREAVRIAQGQGARLLLNGEPAQALALGADGVHLTSAALRALGARPLPAGYWVAASCHDVEDLAHAAAIGVDFAVLAPVQPTASHPGAPALGWEAFHALTELSRIPVYALGGLGPADLAQACRHGAQGIAAIRGLWFDDGMLT